MSDSSDPKAFVLLRYPDAIAVSAGSKQDRYVIVRKSGSGLTQRLGGMCVDEANAWASAAKRLGWRAKS